MTGKYLSWDILKETRFEHISFLPFIGFKLLKIQDWLARNLIFTVIYNVTYCLQNYYETSLNSGLNSRCFVFILNARASICIQWIACTLIAAAFQGSSSYSKFVQGYLFKIPK